MVKKLLCAAAAIFAVCAAATLGGCYDAGTFVSESKNYSGAEVSSLSVDVTDREAEVVPSTDGDIQVEYFSSEKEYYDISLSSDGELKIALVLDKEWSDFIGSQPDMEYRKITVSVPQTLKSIAISTTNEDTIFNSVKAAESVSLNSNGGNVLVEGVAADKISLTSKNGNISGSVCGAYGDYTIDCTIKKGESNLASNAGGDKQLNLNCNNGDIDIKFTA